MKYQISSLIAGLAAVTLLSGCVHPVKPPPSQVTVPGAFEERAPEGRPTSEQELAQWWTVWHDPVLDQLITEALKANTDIRSAQQRVAEARALVTIAESALYPTVSASGAVFGGGADWRVPTSPSTTLPGVLDTAGLQAALEWQANQFQTQTAIVCEVKAEVKETLWDQELNTAFFRIFQEALTNVIRHAKATKVEVRLAEADGQVVLEVRDNGRGISEAEIHNTKSIGLLGIRERAALLGGTLRIQGERGKGTTLTARISKTPGARTRA